MKIVTIVGARPQFIKASCISRLIKEDSSIEEIMIHTGQHFNENMSDVFFEELNIPKPKYNLDIHSLSHGAMTGRMVEEIEKILIDEKPNVVLVYGDTNSTLAGALAAVKLHIPIGHIEAGLRSYNMQMPEEINRILTDHISTFLFCPSQHAKELLEIEGVTKNTIVVGDIMYDAFLYAQKYEWFTLPPKLKPKSYALLTLHREENTKDFEKLYHLFECLGNISERYGMSFIFPVHPRLLKIFYENKLCYDCFPNILFKDPVSYFDMILLQRNSCLILTDSGGIQKEANWQSIPCITLREETEWTELVSEGVNKITGLDTKKIIQAFKEFIESPVKFNHNIYGDGKTSEKILSFLKLLFHK